MPSTTPVQVQSWIETFETMKTQNNNSSKNTKKKPTPGGPSFHPLLGPSSSALHTLMVYRPSVDTVDALIQRMTNNQNLQQEQQQQQQPPSNDMTTMSMMVPEEATDGHGRTPLHVACAYKVDASVVKRLLEGVTRIVPACIKDEDDRLPLHWLFVDINNVKQQQQQQQQQARHNRLALLRRIKRKDDTHAMNRPPCRRDDDNVNNNLKAIVSLLLQANPDSVTIRDKNGCTPMDLARRHPQMMDASIQIMLQRHMQDLEKDKESISLDDDNEGDGDEITHHDNCIFIPRYSTSSRRRISALSMGSLSDDDDDNDDDDQDWSSHSLDLATAAAATTARTTAEEKWLLAQSVPENLGMALLDYIFS